MEPHTGLQQGFRIGSFDVRPLDNELRAGERRKEVSGPAMQLLMELASHPYELVPADALQQTMRTDATALDRYWEELRDALDDRRDAPRYVRQVDSEGFTLMADVLIDAPPIPTSRQILG
jgi:DNA-binding winged helix-turn-helix (wHTH) protein